MAGEEVENENEIEVETKVKNETEIKIDRVTEGICPGLYLVIRILLFTPRYWRLIPGRSSLISCC
jgi:hypothetical protein